MRSEPTLIAVVADYDSTKVRVLCLSTLPTIGAGNRLRIEQYAGLLSKHGIDLTVSAFFDDASARILYREGYVVRKALGTLRGISRRLRDLITAPTYDLVLVYRESAPIGPPIFERILGLLRVPFVFDFDDAIFLGGMNPANRRWSWLRDPARVDETTRRAASVIVANEYLAEWARTRNPRVTVIPTGVDVRRHVARRPHVGTAKVIGWVGSSTTVGYLHEVDAVLKRLAARRGDLTLKVVGGEYSHSSVRVDVLPYDLEREPEDVSSFDIGIMPLPDDAWTRGKAAFKALIYMAQAIPVVASRVGVNEVVVQHGVTGFCVTGDDAWVEALERLIDDPALRQRLGDAGRQRVLTHYSTDVLAPAFATVLRAAGGSRRAPRLRRSSDVG